MERTKSKHRLRTVAVSFATGMAIGLVVLVGLEMVSVKGIGSEVPAKTVAEEPKITAKPQAPKTPANLIEQISNPDSSADDNAGVDAFADASNHTETTIVIRSSVDGGPWRAVKAIYPLKGQRIGLKVDQTAGTSIRWFRICPDTSKDLSGYVEDL
ncbi:MAG: hypothetical protein ACYSWP_18400 [Planctomycetota bacterium]|jgi:hypothetical protein